MFLLCSRFVVICDSLTYVLVSLRVRTNPATAKETKNVKKAIGSEFSCQLEPCKDDGNKSGQRIRTKRPPKPPKTAPMEIESKRCVNLLTRGVFPFEKNGKYIRWNGAQRRGCYLQHERPLKLCLM